MVNNTATINSEQIEALRTAVRGDVVVPEDASYDEARAVYNAMIDKRPSVVIRCQDVNDVIAGVNLGREEGMPVAVRGGGHNAAGLGTCDDGVVLDLGRMNGVRVDADTGRVRVGGGAVWGDVDHATQPFGLAVPAGIISSTGVGGLTLGGGFGHLSRGLRTDLRQPSFRRCGHCRRSDRPGRCRAQSRSFLGTSWRWWKLRRGHVVRVPGASSQYGPWRVACFHARQSRSADAALPGVHH